MTFYRPFLVGVGQVSDDEMRSSSQSLSNVWGGSLIEFSCKESPINVFSSLPQEEGLARLLGDASIERPFGGCWLEALGAWRQPVILIVDSTSLEEVSGIASAYCALCKSFCIPLIGIIQLGGNWDPNKRSQDGLPWCGWIENYQNGTYFEPSTRSGNTALQEIVFVLRHRMMDLSFS